MHLLEIFSKKHGTPQGFWQKIEQRLSMDFQPSASMTGIAILNQIKTSCSTLSGFSHLKINLIFNFLNCRCWLEPQLASNWCRPTRCLSPTRTFGSRSFQVTIILEETGSTGSGMLWKYCPAKETERIGKLWRIGNKAFARAYFCLCYCLNFKGILL